MRYDYKCLNCNLQVEIERSIFDESVAPMCTDCQGTMTRVFASVPVKYNATGFYSTGG